MTIALAYVDEATLVPKGFWMMLLSRLRVPGREAVRHHQPRRPRHWLRKNFILKAGESACGTGTSRSRQPVARPAYVAGSSGSTSASGTGGSSSATGASPKAPSTTCGTPHATSSTSCRRSPGGSALGVDYGTTNPFAALLLGLGTNQRLYLAREWRWDSKLRRRQLTDREYSERLRGWLGTCCTAPSRRGSTSSRPEEVNVKRRRPMTRDEIAAELSASRDLPLDLVYEVLDGLADMGVAVHALVKIEVEEPGT
jgi:hypothetical protein